METPLLSPATGKSENGQYGKCTVNSAVQSVCKAGEWLHKWHPDGMSPVCHLLVYDMCASLRPGLTTKITFWTSTMRRWCPACQSISQPQWVNFAMFVFRQSILGRHWCSLWSKISKDNALKAVPMKAQVGTFSFPIFSSKCTMSNIPAARTRGKCKLLSLRGSRRLWVSTKDAWRLPIWSMHMQKIRYVQYVCTYFAVFFWRGTSHAGKRW